MNAEQAKETLLAWSQSNRLAEAQLSEDGQSLTLNDTTLVNQPLSIDYANKSCSYSLAAIYLQILDPNQGLLSYRNACRRYAVEDPVKAIDKPTVVGYFAVAAAGEETTATVASPAPEHPPAEQEPQAEEAPPKKDKRSKDRKESKRKHHHDKHAASRKKKAPKEVTNEQLFSNLNVVVDKRQMEQDVHQATITKALSAEGFMVDAEQLAQYRQRTQAILANEIPVGTSASILRAINPRKNLQRVLEIFTETVNPPKKKSKPESSGHEATSKTAKTYLMGKKPVIIVPKGMTAPLTLLNAHEFLCHGRFVPRDVLMKQGRHRNPPTTFTRQVRRSATGNGGLLEYEILDNPKKLGANPKEWERIVAVIVLGHSWQFKDWPGVYSNPVHLFARTFGFYICMEGDKIPTELSGWAVKQARLNRDKRGLDMITYASFWNGLDEWMAVHRSELLPQPES